MPHPLMSVADLQAVQQAVRAAEEDQEKEQREHQAAQQVSIFFLLILKSLFCHLHLQVNPLLDTEQIFPLFTIALDMFSDQI